MQARRRPRGGRTPKRGRTVLEGISWMLRRGHTGRMLYRRSSVACRLAGVCTASGLNVVPVGHRGEDGTASRPRPFSACASNEFPTPAFVNLAASPINIVAEFFQAILAGHIPATDSGAFCLEDKPTLQGFPLLFLDICAALFKEFGQFFPTIEVLVKDATVQVQCDVRNIQAVAPVPFIVKQLHSIDIVDVAVGPSCGTNNVVVMGDGLSLKRPSRRVGRRPWVCDIEVEIRPLGAAPSSPQSGR